MSDRRQGVRYTDRGDVFEWVNGCESIPMRVMSEPERATADYALRWARTESPDDALDVICEWANRCEARSYRAEERGRHADASAWQQAAEFADVLVCLV